MKATVFGARGYIGSNLADALQAQGWHVRRVVRGDETWRGQDLGHVFFCVGLTADFRQRPLEAIDAHVAAPVDVLRRARYASFLYLSTTRVYSGATQALETARITVDPTDPSDLYNLSKLTGEAACLAVPQAEVRIARLSNVYGPAMGDQNFLGSILADARRGRIRLGQALESEKDYIALGDLLPALQAIALRGTERIYNVAAGANVGHGAILAELERLTGCRIEIDAAAPTVRFPAIRVERLGALQDLPGARLISDLAILLQAP